MSDTSAPAPAPSAAPATQPAPQPAPARSEVPINPAPTNAPRPIPQQAVPVPEKSVRGSLQAAFDRAQNPPPKGERPKPKEAPPAAEAKAGHNQPPEETPKLDLKKRPDEQQQPRDRGRFAPRERAEGEIPGNSGEIPGNSGEIQNATNQPQNVAGEQNQTYKRLPPHAPYADPPPRMAEHGKRDWADTPETVRGEVARMHQEFGRAVQQYQGVAEAFKPIARYHQMAQQHGTTLEKALDNFVGIETKLRSDPIAGLDQIIYNLDLKDPQTGQRLGLRDIAYHVLSSSPEQLKQVQLGNSQQAASQQIGELHQKVSALERQNQQMQYERQYQQQFTYTRSAIDQFAETHPRIDEPTFGEIVKNEISLGFDLPTAYRRAELLNPATHAAQTRDPPAQTRQTDRSISGNPGVAPSNGASRKSKPSGSPREALENAMQRLNS